MLHHHLLSLSSLAAVGLLVGCDQTASVSPSATSLPGALAPANGSKPRPWKESYRATGTIAPDEDRCPAPLLLVSLNGGGTATHIGKYTITNSHCVDPSTGALTSGTFVKTAANGDQIFGTYVGSSAPSSGGTFSVSGTVTFTGGTGRFAGATGSATMAGTLQADFSQAPFPTQVALTMVGTISY